MKTYTAEELTVILDKHRKWLENEEGGERAYLQGANLYRANLREADLQGAYLQGADLSGANLQGANLQRAYLQRANLSGAYLQGADLQLANLYRANLSGAYLQGADLTGARVNWQSHDLIAELLRRTADDTEKRKVAGLILLSRDWCWADFQQKCGSDPLFTWAIETLRQYVQGGDNAPAILREEAGL